MLFNSVKPVSLMSIFALVLVVLVIAPASTLAQTGDLTVTIDPAEAVAAGAEWRRVGTGTWYDSGATETSVTVGDYMIEFKKIDLWQTPSFRIVTVVNGQLASTSRDYLPGVGSLVIWGDDLGYGELDVPEPNAGFVQTDGGWYHNIGLKVDGTIVAWGSNDNGQCDIPEPNSDFVQVASNAIQNAGLKADGTIAIWGIKISDGTGSTSSQIDYLPAEENHDFVAIALGGSHCLGLRNDGSIYAGGHNYDGVCIVPDPNSDFVAVSAGNLHSLGLKSDGSIVAWGNNDYGQCDVPEPNSGFVAIAAGPVHNVALKSDDTVVMWGNIDYGQCNLPVENSDFVKIATSDFFSVGLKSDGSVTTFGYYYEPVSIVPEPNSGFLAVEANFRNMIGLKPTGVITTTIEPGEAVAAGAQWSIDGGATWMDSGDNIAGLDAGDYTVQFKPLDGWITPEPQVVTVVDGPTTEISVSYTRQPVDASVVWVDFNYSGEEWGSEAQPYNTLAEGVTAVASGGTIRIKSGASGTPSRITTPVRIEASGGPVTLGRGPVSVNQAISPAGDSKGGAKATGRSGDLLNQKNAVIEWVEYE